ncbi:MAG: hypothetical protein C4542_08005 [Dehalococcoidia bacterium]|nr:MAG: hypothetical protein C4542_08005 [Dehalococcoidia bacterium]
MTDHLLSRECPACHGYKMPGLVVCMDCWPRMNGKVKERLLKPDVYAVGRRLYFYQMLEQTGKIDMEISFPDKKNLERESVKSRGSKKSQQNELL